MKPRDFETYRHVLYTGTSQQSALLDAVCESRAFKKAPVQCAFFKYAADKTQKQLWEDLTQEAIFEALFKHDSSLSNVATTANHLRLHLAEFYKHEGASHLLRFDMPVRTYLVTVTETQDGSDYATERETNHGISLGTFRTFIEELAEFEGIDSKDLDARTAQWIPTYEDAKELGHDQRTFAHLFDHLDKRNKQLTFSQMRDFAIRMGIHALMLDPLLSEPVKTPCLLLDLESTTSTPSSALHGRFRRVVGRTNTSIYGKAQYSIPEKRLAETDAAFVYVVLPPGDGSDAHHHPNDELIVVLTGRVELVLIDSGVRIELHEGDYAHFNADQNHTARNLTSDPASMFVIRFYHLGVPNTRQAMRHSLRAATRQQTPRRLDDDTWAWIQETAAQRPRFSRSLDSDTIPDRVENSIGLARLLSRLPLPKKTHFKKRINRTLTPEQWLSELQFDRIDTPVRRIRDIEAVYEAYNLLLADFIFPSVPREVVVRRDESFRDWADAAAIAKRVFETSADPGVHYEIPKRSLSCSDVSIAMLSLEVGRNTISNSHPGYELLLPLHGTVRVERNGELMCTVSKGQVAHYDSETPHLVSNKSSERAEMIVIRFFREDRFGASKAPAKKQAAPRRSASKAR
jgi:quercetin dioxygenase-like cupin family protein